MCWKWRPSRTRSRAARPRTRVEVEGLEAGADDVVSNDDGSFEVFTGPYDFVTVKDALVKAGFTPEFAEVTMKPATENDWYTEYLAPILAVRIVPSLDAAIERRPPPLSAR